MKFDLKQAKIILSRTPHVLSTLLSGLPEAWTHQDEGPNTWSPYDIIGHYIHGEKTDWIPRAKVILFAPESEKTFVPFDRFAQFMDSKGKTIEQLLAEFAELRAANLKELDALKISKEHLELKGIHPELGEVSLGQLLATWVTHDLNHIGQISRVMAKLYKEQVGPWTQYISILNQ